jgi:hypothetical protein
MQTVTMKLKDADADKISVLPNGTRTVVMTNASIALLELAAIATKHLDDALLNKSEALILMIEAAAATFALDCLEILCFDRDKLRGLATAHGITVSDEDQSVILVLGQLLATSKRAYDRITFGAA